MLDLHFKRPELASDLAHRMLGRSVLATNTLFLRAPRWTGKSTFLQHELKPALEAKGALVLYTDLWKEKQRNPAELIGSAVANALVAQQGGFARAVGSAEVCIHGLFFKLDAVGKALGATLVDALDELQDKAGRPVVLIVDEAQHAISSATAMNIMFSLKSARDTMNKPGDIKLGLVMSGSYRDTLLRLVSGNAAPFLGSQIDELPTLDQAYTDHITGLLAVEHPALAIDNTRTYAAFERFNHRPDFFIDGLKAAIGAFTDPTHFNDLLDEAAERYIEDLRVGYATAYQRLTKIQRAVLTRVLSHGREGKLFTNDALAEYSKTHGRKVQASTARAAVEKLRELDPPLIWKSSRGDYALEDSGMGTWYEERVRVGD